MKRAWVLLGLGLVLLVVSGGRGGALAAWEKIDPAVLAATQNGRAASFLVVLTDQTNLNGVVTLTAGSTVDKVARGRVVYETLAGHAARTQAPLRALLEARAVAYRAYWVHNMILVRGDRGVVEALAARADVALVRANTWQRVALPEMTSGAAGLIAAGATGVEWNVAHIRAPEVWAAGVNGAGVVIGGQDTGYDWQHPALKNRYRGWNGATADHNYNWHDAIHEDLPLGSPGNSCGFDVSAPCDDGSHGTHTMGTMIGGAPGDAVGVAPGAQWIGCRNMEDGWGSPATYAECYEWFIAPYPIGGDPFTDGDPARAPHVINNSWACLPSEGCAAPDVLQAVVEAVRAAGIVTVHSAGNAGPKCSSIDDPAAIYDASFTAGATDGADDIASFSGRGPVGARRAPDVTAPGVDVRSSTPGDGYGSSSGTSMAAPHVAALTALLISADPSLAGQVDVLEGLITSTAVPLTTGQGCGDDTADSVPNNVYGWGRIDALAAFSAIDRPELTIFTFVPAVVDVP